MFPILNEHTVVLVSTLRAALDRDDVPEPEHWRLVEELVEQLTPEQQRDGTIYRDDDGTPKIGVATCGTCGRSWDDALGSSWTPAPSGRCPFEYDHDDDDRDERVQTAVEIVAQMNRRLDAYAMSKVSKDDVRAWLKAIVHTLEG